LLCGSIASPVAAQVAAGARGGGGRVVMSDSVVVRAMTVGGKIDTVMAIFRMLNHEQVGSPTWFELSRRLDSLVLPNGGPARIMLRGGFNPQFPMTRGWIGFVAQGPQ